MARQADAGGGPGCGDACDPEVEGLWKANTWAGSIASITPSRSRAGLLRRCVQISVQICALSCW